MLELFEVSHVPIFLHLVLCQMITILILNLCDEGSKGNLKLMTAIGIIGWFSLNWQEELILGFKVTNFLNLPQWFEILRLEHSNPFNVSYPFCCFWVLSVHFCTYSASIAASGAKLFLGPNNSIMAFFLVYFGLNIGVWARALQQNALLLQSFNTVVATFDRSHNLRTVFLPHSASSHIMRIGM